MMRKNNNNQNNYNNHNVEMIDIIAQVLEIYFLHIKESNKIKKSMNNEKSNLF